MVAGSPPTSATDSTPTPWGSSGTSATRRSRPTIVGKCPRTLSVPAVKAIADAARAYGLNVQLRPLIRVGPPRNWSDPQLSWEGFIKPTDKKAWFRNLLRAETPYLKLLRLYPGSKAAVASEPWAIADSSRWLWLLVRPMVPASARPASRPRSTDIGVASSRRGTRLGWTGTRTSTSLPTPPRRRSRQRGSRACIWCRVGS